MRLRNIPGAEEVVSNSIYCIDDPTEWKGHWNELFENDHPIHMEIGMGKGRFIMDLARQNPEVNYIGVERYTSVLLRAVQKMESDPLPNIRFLCIDAAMLPEYFAQDEVKKIYLNFSDPWPKDRHAKRRLTSKEFLARYEQVLDSKGTIEFKTDNRSLFDFSVDTVEESTTWNLDAKTYDLHHDESMNQGNIMTEYEEKFSSKGNPIHKLIASRILTLLLAFAIMFTGIRPVEIHAETKQYWPKGVSVTSDSAVVMEVNTGTVLYSKNPDEQHYPASITKILTCLLVVENCEMDEIVTFSPTAIYDNQGDGSHIARDIGEELTVEQCLYAVMLVSANECAYALAEHVGKKLGGDYNTFIDMMNDRAKKLGCKNSHFANCNGLPNSDHYTTAQDYALVAAEAYKNEDFRIVCGTKSYTIPETNKHKDKYYCHNHNNLIYPYKFSKYLYKYCTGGKTGYTSAAKHTLVTYAEKDGMTLVCVVMYVNSPYQWEDSIKLYDYCFDNFQVFNIAENEDRLKEDESTDYGLLNYNDSFLTFNQDAYIIVPKTAEFLDAEYSMGKADDGSVQISYTYGGKEVGNVKLVEAGNKIEQFPLTETIEKVDPNLNVVKVNPWYIVLIVVCIAAVAAIAYFVIYIIKNFYVIRNRIYRRLDNRAKYKERKIRKKKYRKRDRMFR